MEVDPNKRISWDDYFIHPFFIEDIESLNENVNKINLSNSSFYSNINPFEILGKKENEINEIILNYSNFEDSPNEKKFLSYYILKNKDKFNRTGNIFNIKIKDHFYYVVINDLNNLKNLYNKNKYIIAEKDENGFTLLHYSVIGGYYEITEFLLNKGINYDEPTNGDRPVTLLYYAKGKIKKLLKINGSRISQYNAVKEIFPTGINIQYKDFNTIESIYKQFFAKGIVKNIKKIEKNGEIIGIRLIRNQRRGYMSDEKKNWEKVYHGTRFVSIESILSHGLRCFGEPLTYHIPLGEKIDNIDNWVWAIFVSPSIFYASKYSEIIYSENQEWFIIIEANVNPQSFTKHGNTIYGYKFKISEPEQIEYRIDIKNLCFCSDGSVGPDDERNIETISLLFVKKRFMERCENYIDNLIFEKI